MRQDYKNPLPKLLELTQTASPIKIGNLSVSEDVTNEISGFKIYQQEGYDSEWFYLHVEDDEEKDNNTDDLTNSSEKYCNNHHVSPKFKKKQTVPVLMDKPRNPLKIGDTRMKYEVLESGVVSVVAKQQNNTLVPLIPSEEYKVRQLSLVGRGNRSVSELCFLSSKNSTRTQTLLQMASTVLSSFGFYLLFSNLVPSQLKSNILLWSCTLGSALSSLTLRAACMSHSLLALYLGIIGVIMSFTCLVCVNMRV